MLFPNWVKKEPSNLMKTPRSIKSFGFTWIQCKSNMKVFTNVLKKLHYYFEWIVAIFPFLNEVFSDAHSGKMDQDLIADDLVLPIENEVINLQGPLALAFLLSFFLTNCPFSCVHIKFFHFVQKLGAPFYLLDGMLRFINGLTKCIRLSNLLR